MALTINQMRDLYRKRSANYDLTAKLYYLIGFREAKYRKMALSALQLKAGDKIVDIGCGTGLNFKYLLASIGESGRLIGVDLTDAMLEKARERVERNGWKNIDLVQSDAAKYSFPYDVNAVVSTLALTFVPEYEEVIKRASRALGREGRFAIFDMKKPDAWPLWLVRLFVFAAKPFGVSLDLAERRPWETLEKYFSNVSMKELYGGFAYVVVGEKTK